MCMNLEVEPLDDASKLGLLQTNEKKNGGTRFNVEYALCVQLVNSRNPSMLFSMYILTNMANCEEALPCH